jgi:putative sterol carrier protein
VTEFDFANVKNLEPQEFAQMVKLAKKGELEEIMAGPHRRDILDTIFGRMPSQFRADRAGGTNAVIRWNITGPDEPDRYDVTIANGTCTTGPSGDAEPKVEFTLGGPEFLSVVSGVGNPTMMFMTGKLKFTGDMALATSVPNLFAIPKG